MYFESCFRFLFCFCFPSYWVGCVSQHHFSCQALLMPGCWCMALFVQLSEPKAKFCECNLTCQCEMVCCKYSLNQYTASSLCLSEHDHVKYVRVLLISLISFCGLCPGNVDRCAFGTRSLFLHHIHPGRAHLLHSCHCIYTCIVVSL